MNWPGDVRPLWVRARANRSALLAGTEYDRKIGRPRMPEEERRDSIVNVRFTETEHKQLTAIAANGVTLSEWARRVILKAARRDRP